MRYILLLFVFLICLNHNIRAQINQQLLSVKFGYGINTYSMNKLNKFYIDSFAMIPTIDLLQNHIKRGEQFYVNLSYQPNNHFDIGISSSYQYGKSSSKPIFTETDEYGFPIKDHCGSFQLRTEAISIGIAATWYIDGLLKWYEKESSLNRFHFGVEVNGGVGFSKVVADLQYSSLPFASSYFYFTSRDFQGQFGVKAEYDFTNSPIFTTLGIRFGYQYFKTGIVKDRMGEEWVVLDKYPISLDFSGFYGGIYLKIGK